MSKHLMLHSTGGYKLQYFPKIFKHRLVYPCGTLLAHVLLYSKRPKDHLRWKYLSKRLNQYRKYLWEVLVKVLTKSHLFKELNHYMNKILFFKRR